MTEAEWLACAAPSLMLRHVRRVDNAARSKVGRRKLRLFGCACCRRVWDVLTPERSRRAVVVAELFAEGLVGADELRPAWAAAIQVQPREPRVALAAIAAVRPQPWKAAGA